MANSDSEDRTTRRLADHPLFRERQPGPSEQEEVTLPVRVFGNPIEAEVAELIEEGWDETSAREAVAVRRGELGGGSGRM